MPKLNMTVPHNLTREEATKRVKALLGDVKTKFADKISDLHEEWDGNVGKFNFSAMGFAVSGTLTVKPSGVEISGRFPIVALPFKGKIESTRRDRARTLLV